MTNDAKFEEELTGQSKINMRNWRIFTRALENLKNLHFNGLPLNKVYNVWVRKSVEELCLMTLNIDAKFEEKMTCAFKNNMRNLENFYQGMIGSLKIGTLMGSFIQSRKCISLKFTWEFCVMAMKNDAKFEEELNFQFKIDMRNLMKFGPSTQESQKFAL